MPFQVSPGVNTSEIDLTTGVPAVATTEGAVAGVFRWGPVESPTLVGSEVELAHRFGKPTASNFETFFTAASFLSYGNQLFVSRAVDNAAFNAVAATSTVANTLIKNADAYDSVVIPAAALYVGKYPGAIGNSIRVAVCDSAAAFQSTSGAPADANNTVQFAFTVGSNSATLTVTNSAGSNTAATNDATAIMDSLTVGDKLLVGNTSIGQQYVAVTSKTVPVITAAGVATATISLADRISTAANTASATVQRNWEFFDAVNRAPGTSEYALGAGGTGDEMHVVVVDDDGQFTGGRGTILEVFESVSRATDAKGTEGGSIYYKQLINNGSQYIWFGNDRAGAPSVLASAVVASTNVRPLSLRMTQGTDGGDESNIAMSALTAAYDVFRSAANVDFSLLMAGKARGATLANYLIDNIVEARKDSMVFISPQREDVVGVPGQETTKVVAFRNLLRSSSYAVLDSGYKYMYDKYNDVFRYVPLNGDIAGLAVRTDQLRDPWFSPAGFNRGQIRNVVKLSWNPDKTQQGLLYKNGINPVVNFPGQGVVLFGDKTLLAKPSAFDRINVRRLFIVLEKAIAIAARDSLFEFNDEFTRAQFRNIVEPFLRDVQGRRGLTDFRVVVDETNNTPEVIDRNEFIGDIYIKPARSINFIQLNFVAVRTGVDFNEIVGQF